MTTAELAIELGINRSSVHKQAARLFNDGLVEREQLPNNSNLWKIAGRS
jgi:predicted transcriptional regulator